jgi:hypothetical protein
MVCAGGVGYPQISQITRITDYVSGNLKLAFSWRFETEHISRLASSSN